MYIAATCEGETRLFSSPSCRAREMSTTKHTTDILLCWVYFDLHA